MMNKRVISLFTLIAMVVSLLGAFSTVFASDGIQMSLNGNAITSDSKVVKLDNGVFAAQTEGAGLFALGFYKDGELTGLEIAEGTELSSARLNMVVDKGLEGYESIKLFRFDENGNPLCINHDLKPTYSDNQTRIHFNETFDNNETRYNPDGTTIKVENEKVTITGDDKHFPTMGLKNPERYTTVEVDYEITTDSWPNVRIICGYDTGFSSFVRMRGDGLYAGDAYKKEHRAPGISKAEILNTYYNGKNNRKFHFAVVIDSETKKFKVMLDGNDLTFTDSVNGGAKVIWMDINSRIDTANIKSGFSIQYAHTAENTTVYIDNLRAYSGDSYIDIGSAIPNVHNTDYITADSTYSSRPEAAEIAKRVLASGHPRVMIDSDRVAEIKASSDATVLRWKDEIIQKADVLLSKDIYSYEAYDPTDSSLAKIENTLADIMNLGLAYQLSDDAGKKAAYAARAYKQVEVFMTFKAWHESAGGTDKWVQNDWNSDSYLDVGEISTIMAVCYDWMYDAWTPAQKKAIADAVRECSIDLSYNIYFGTPNKKEKNKTDIGWWRSTNNWNAVCNGGVLTAAIAFMEEDIHKCSQLAEGTIRGFEYLLPKFYPDGGWYEGTGYWAYTMKYLTIACSTLRASCGELFGLENTPGFKRSQTYSLDLEGSVGSFAYGDGSSDRVKAPYMFFWADVYKDDKIGGAAKYAMEHFGFAANAFDLIYYNPEYVSDSYIRELATYRSGTEVVVIASGHEANDTAVAISGGPGVATSHDHLDSGSIIVDMAGMRLIADTGAEHYKATGYFADGRYYYYKARPEGHNVFVINPEVLSDASGEFYHGQSKNGVSTATLDEDTGVATMNLSAAYERDANSAQRKLYLTNDNAVVVEDEIDIKSDGSHIEWYYHFKDILSYVYDGSTYYKPNTFVNADGRHYCEVEIDNADKCVYITYQDYTVSGKNKVSLDGTYKTFKITFESETSFIIERRDAERNPYDAEIIKSLTAGGKFLNDYHTYADVGTHHKYTDNGGTYPMDKIVVNMADASGMISLKTTIEEVK